MTGRILVRGAGAVSALGVGLPTILAGRKDGSDAPPPMSEDGVRLAPFDALRDLPRAVGRRCGRQPGLALAAVLEAVEGHDITEDTALVLGTAHGARAETVAFIEGCCEYGPAKGSPMLFARSLHNTMAGVVGTVLGLSGPACVATNGPVSFESALLLACLLLRNGRARRAVVGAADTYHAIFGRGARLVGRAPRPDDPVDAETGVPTAGLPPGEGSGALLLELGGADESGVAIEDVIVGRRPLRSAPAPHACQWMCSRDARSRRRHAAAVADFAPRADVANVSFPALRHGVFGSLSAVATAAEAGRRLGSATDSGPVLVVSAPRRTCPAAVLLSGHGIA